MDAKTVIEGKLIGNMFTDADLAEKYHHLGPGIWDEEDCGYVRHLAIMSDGRVFDLGEADLNLVHQGTSADFEQFEIVAKAA